MEGSGSIGSNEDGPFQMYARLWEHIDTALAGLQSPSRLQRILRHYKAFLLNPLKHQPRNEQARKEVEGGSIVLDGRGHRLSEEFRKQAVQLSEVLELNEYSCVELLRLAYQQQARYVELEGPDIALLIFFEERRFLLHSILTLLKSRDDVRLSDELRRLISTFTNELIAEGLSLNIIKLIGKLTDEVEKMSGQEKMPLSIVNDKQEERKKLAECLFYIYYQTVIPGDEAMKIIELLSKCGSTKTLLRDPSASYNVNFQVLYILTLTVCCFLDITHELISPKTGEASHNKLMDDPKFIEEFDKQITTLPSENFSFHSAITLSWALFLQALSRTDSQVASNFEQYILKAIKQEVLLLLSEVVESRPFKQDSENRDIYISVLHDLVSELLQNLSPWETRETDRYFANLLSLISFVYKDQPVLSAKFWVHEPGSYHLHYFIRYAGDRLGESLFVPYMNMLASLASGTECSQYAYHFLKNSTHKFVNWDHFFAVLEQYYLEYQENNQPEQYPLYYNQVQVRGKVMRPEDVEGLESILRLMQAVLSHNQNTRTLMNENPHWHPLESLFGLLVCPVPPSLKAQLTLTIAAFAKSAELVGKIWQFLEAAQVLQAAVKPGVEGGIKYELEEVESRSETYPYTTAFLKLIGQLIQVSIPSQLGYPNRVPGFLPYLVFVRESVFLRFNNRAYQNSGDQWVVAAHALRIFLKVLEEYDVSPKDFTEEKIEIQGKQVSLHKSPGFELMKNFLEGTPVLKKVLWILDQGNQRLEEEKLASGGESFEESVLLSLQILEIILNKESFFMERLRLSNSPINVNPLDQLLLQERNQIATIAKFISYPHNQRIALFSVKIIHRLSATQDKLVSIFLENGEELSILSGYVNRLQSTEIEPTESDVEEEDEIAKARHLELQNENSVRLEIMKLLLDNLEAPTPNLTHFLLGYNTDSVDESDLSSTPITCLHVIVTLLASPTTPLQYPFLSELMYEFIYRLCADELTGRPAMDYLRNKGYFGKQLDLMKSSFSPELMVYQLNQRAWLLKTVALELHATPSNHHRQELIARLFDVPLPSQEGDEAVEEEMDDWEQPRMKTLELLDAFDFHLNDPPSFKKHLFTVDPEQLTYISRRNFPLIDVMKLHQVLLEEKRRADFSGMQSSLLYEEIHDLLLNAIQKNKFTELFHAQAFAFETWKQIVEIALSDCYSILRRMGKESVLYELLEILLQKLNATETRLQLVTHMSAAVLALMTKLREQKHIVGLSIDALASGHDVPVSQLHSILTGIVSGITRITSSQVMRGNLYTALINYLQFTSRPTVKPLDLSMDTNQMHVSAEEIESRQRALEEGNSRIFENAGEKLVKVISEDASDGTDVCKSVAFSALDVLAMYDRKHRWLFFLCQNGYVVNWLNELKSVEEQLMQLLSPTPDSLSFLYVYESKMSFLNRVSQTPQGSATLFQIGALRTLTACKFIDERPEDGDTDRMDSLPSVTERYDQLVLPVLRLICSFLMALPKNEDLASDVLDFVDIHSELFSTTLKDRLPSITVGSLHTLKLVTSIFYHLSFHDTLMKQKMQSKSLKFQNLMLDLFPKYCIRERWSKRFKPISHHDTDMMTITSVRRGPDLSTTLEVEEANNLVLEICKNLTAYGQVSSERVGEGRLFDASVADAMSKRAEDIPLSSTARGHRPSLGLLIFYLKSCLDQLLRTRKEQDQYQFKLSHITELSPEEINQYASRAPSSEDTSPQQRQFFAQFYLSQYYAEKSKQISTLFFIIENALWILWKHLDLFFHMAPYKKGSPGFPVTEPATAPTGPETVDREQLRRDLVSLLGRQPHYGQTESTLTLLTQLDKMRKPSFIYFVVKKLRDIIRD